MTREHYLIHRKGKGIAAEILYAYWNDIGKPQISMSEFIDRIRMFLSMGYSIVGYQDILSYFDNKFDITTLYDKNMIVLKVY